MLFRYLLVYQARVVVLRVLFLFFSVDSIMLLEEGFSVLSTDASDKMLKYALKERWARRKEGPFEDWGKRAFKVTHLINKIHDLTLDPKCMYRRR